RADWLGLYVGCGWRAGRKSVFPFIRWSAWYPKAQPGVTSVPFLICTSTAAPPANPCSASKLFVTTFTVSIASSPGTKAAQKVIHTFEAVAPSIRQFIPVLVVPLTLVFTARAGFTRNSVPVEAGEKPGKVANTA